MNMEYFKEQICDELDGAWCYAKHALEIKAMMAAWGKMFLEMANAELGHANNLFRMMNEYYAEVSKAYTKMPDYMETLRQEIIDEYTKKSAEVKWLIDLYNK